MNIILFEAEELKDKLAYEDSRAVHISTVLGLDAGDGFSAGIINGALGRGLLLNPTAQGWQWSFQALGPPIPLHSLTLVLGCPRPPVAQRLLRDMTALGLKEIRICTTDLSEKSYLTSKLWRNGLWRKALINGAMQGASTLLPGIKTSSSLETALEGLSEDNQNLRIALDNGAGAGCPDQNITSCREAVLAVGPERGWSDRERLLLEAKGFARTLIGNRIIRTETACSVGSALLLSALGEFSRSGNPNCSELPRPPRY